MSSLGQGQSPERSPRQDKIKAVVTRFLGSMSLTGDMELVFDAAKLPVFDTTTFSRWTVAAELGQAVGPALRAYSELSNSVPAINTMQDEHITKAEQALKRSLIEIDSTIDTLRVHPKVAALKQVVHNELDASSQLGQASNSIMVDLTQAYESMDGFLNTLDAEAALVLIGEAQTVSWGLVARGAIVSYLDI